MSTVACTLCSGALSADDVGPGDAARCRACRTVSDPEAARPGEDDGAAVFRRADVPLPDAITLREDEAVAPPTGNPSAYRTASPAPQRGAMTLERRWFTWNYVIINLIVGPLFALIMSQPLGRASGGGGGPYLPDLALRIVLCSGLGYVMLALLINRTVVRVTDAEIEVRHVPLPWYRNRRLAADDVACVHCSVIERDEAPNQYGVYARRLDGDEVRLLTVPEFQEAIAFEQRINARLGIVEFEFEFEGEGERRE